MSYVMTHLGEPFICTNSWVSDTKLQIVLLTMVFHLLVEGPSWRLFLVLSRPSLLVGSCRLFTFRRVLSLSMLVIDALPSHCDHVSICILFPALLHWNSISGTSVIVALLASHFFVVVFVHVPFDWYGGGQRQCSVRLLSINLIVDMIFVLLPLRLNLCCRLHLFRSLLVILGLYRVHLGFSLDYLSYLPLGFHSLSLLPPSEIRYPLFYIQALLYFMEVLLLVRVSFTYSRSVSPWTASCRKFLHCVSSARLLLPLPVACRLVCLHSLVFVLVINLFCLRARIRFTSFRYRCADGFRPTVPYMVTAVQVMAKESRQYGTGFARIPYRTRPAYRIRVAFRRTAAYLGWDLCSKRYISLIALMTCIKQ